MAQGEGGGRPLKFKSVTKLQTLIDAYFAACDPHWVDDVVWQHPKDEEGKIDFDAPQEAVTLKRLTMQVPYTITGLALALDTSRETLINYEERRGKYFDTIKRAKLKCQHYTELALYDKYSTGPIFSLKNNYGWRDRSEQDLTTNGKDIPVPILGGMSKQDVPTDNRPPEAR